MIPILERLQRRLKVGANGCLEWQGFRDKDGYGQISKGKEGEGLLITHRVAWEAAFGPIPDGMSVLHKCDNPPCCNEEHLFLGTQGDNMADMKAKGRGTSAPGKFKLDPIFKGGISSGSLRALYAFLEEKKGTFDRYAIPSVGNYTAAQAVVQAGIDPDRIHCSDTNLYSAVLGYLFDPTTMIDDLGFHALDPTLVTLLTRGPTTSASYGDEVAAAARILYALKWCQLQGTTEYVRQLLREVEDAAEHILNAYAATLSEMVSLFAGLHFELRGAHDHIPDETSNKAALIVFNTTHYARVHPATGAFTWDYPPGIDLKPNETKEVKIADASACILIYGAEGGGIDDLVDGEEFDAMYAELNVKKMTRTYFMCNRPSAVALANRRKFRKVPAELPPIYDDHEITAETQIGFVLTDKDTALYFYDLFVKDLGMVDAEVFYLFCIDGQVAGALGLDSNHYRFRRIPLIYQTFGLSLTSERYARIGRLIIAGLCSQQFIDQFVVEWCPKDLMLPPIAEIQTTCLTKFHEAKKNRGLMKLISREKLPNGRFQLVYRTKVHPTSYRDVVEKWIKKHAGFARKAQGGTTQ